MEGGMMWDVAHRQAAAVAATGQPCTAAASRALCMNRLPNKGKRLGPKLETLTGIHLHVEA